MVDDTGDAGATAAEMLDSVNEVERGMIPVSTQVRIRLRDMRQISQQRHGQKLLQTLESNLSSKIAKAFAAFAKDLFCADCECDFSGESNEEDFEHDARNA